MESEEKKRQRRALLKALTAIPAAALVPSSSAGGAEGKPVLAGTPASTPAQDSFLPARFWTSTSGRPSAF